MSLRDKKITELQRQQREIKGQLTGRKNGNCIQEIPLVRKTLEVDKQKVISKPSLHQKKVNLMREKMMKMKNPLSKISVKSFY